MPAEFSRRSFLKYTALTAVAVAGSSLLTGCSGENPVQTATGTSNKVLKVTAALDSAVYNAAAKTLTFEMTITNGRKNALEINRRNFSVVVPTGSYYACNNSLIRVFNTSESPSLQVKNGVTQTYTIIASEFPGFDAGPVRLTYEPDFKYNEYTANWVLKEDAVETASEDAVAVYTVPGLEV